MHCAWSHIILCKLCGDKGYTCTHCRAQSKRTLKLQRHCGPSSLPQHSWQPLKRPRALCRDGTKPITARRAQGELRKEATDTITHR
mmetsp:Transcript_19101/g.53234  ORF Transcript_19101/g.53234 Transcript_19101/m.53234 type:complete len:86 (-) Transcript_19101:263-520(-)